MREDVKTRWLAALRSGEYKQGRKQLATEEGKFCCLGVLCEISGLKYDKDAAFPPKAIIKWAGLEGQVDEENDPVINWRGESSLALNNDYGKRFETIANLIEKYL
jgi:hypothetical protein